MSHKAFVSSTFKDLKAHRVLLIDLLRKSGINVDPMEDWSSAADEPQVFSQQRVAGCDLCVLLVARRRGHVPDSSKDSRSITQMEYDYARAHRIDVLPFFLQEDAEDWPAEFDERVTDPLLKEWQEQLRARHGVGTFGTDPASLVKVAAEAVSRWKDRKHETTNLHAYLRNVEEEFGVLRILSVPNYRDEDNRNIRIDRLYVEPAVGPHWLSPDRSPKDWHDPPGALDVFLQHPRLVLLGDPGSGKSTLVAWVAWQFAVDAQPDGRRTDWPERLGRSILGPVIPLPFVLRLLNVDEHVTWDRLVQTFLAQPLGKPLHGVDLERYLKDGLALILLDGLDEVGSVKARQALRAAVLDGMRRYPTCRWLMTSRLVGYEEVHFHRWIGYGRNRWRLERDWLVDDDVEADVVDRDRVAELRYLAPFDDPRVEEFARNWYTVRENSEVRIRQGSADLVKAIRQDPGTQSLGRVPYLLTLMALVHRVDARLPNGRALLYNKIAEAYLQTIDDFRDLQERRETLPVKKRWLARVGYEMQCRRAQEKESKEGAMVAGTKDVCQWVAQAMNSAKPAAALADAEVFVNYISRRTGLLLPRGEGKFGFVHLSFQEYFAACHLKQQVVSPAWLSGHWQQTLREYANESIWREALIFLCELIANSDEAEWLGSVLTCTFGEDLALVAPERKEEQNRAVLLARLVADPQSGLLGEERTRAIAACCRWEVAAQNWVCSVERLRSVAEFARIRSSLRPNSGEFGYGPGHSAEHFNRANWVQNRIWDHEPLVAAALFTAHEEDQGEIANAFVGAVCDAGLQKLTLKGTQIADVGPLAKLTNLQYLNLAGTAVADVGPLAKLTNLFRLVLKETAVVDVGPLTTLAKLINLHLLRTLVVDVGPLATLANLEFLDLDYMPVTDVEPLAKLTNLTALYLVGTKAPKEEVAKLRKSLPRCTIVWSPESPSPLAS